MTVSTQIPKLAKAVVLAMTLGAILVPAAQAKDRIVDDWFRDVTRTAAPQHTQVPQDVRDHRQVAQLLRATNDRIVDDWFRDPQAAPPLAAAPVANRIVDDYFRDPVTVVASQPSAGGFDWGDFGIGAAAMLGLVVLAAGLGLGALAARDKGGKLRTP
jgi:hypothetical protein